ncbi:MAG: hypothetical protein PVI97_12760, partial [Candidatus Thiodiazotropha sp.]
YRDFASEAGGEAKFVVNDEVLTASTGGRPIHEPGKDDYVDITPYPNREDHDTTTPPYPMAEQDKDRHILSNPLPGEKLPWKTETPAEQAGVHIKPYMTQESKDVSINGSSNVTIEVGCCEAQNIPDQTGRDKEELEETLIERGFTKKQRGSYDEWIAPDGSKIFVRPNGEIVRQGPKRSNPADPHNSPRIRDRFDQNGNIIPYNPEGTSHSTGEIVK